MQCISCLQIICGQNCTFVIQSNGTVMACGEGSYGRLGQGNSDDLHSLTIISALQGQSVLSLFMPLLGEELTAMMTTTSPLRVV